MCVHVILLSVGAAALGCVWGGVAELYAAREEKLCVASDEHLESVITTYYIKNGRVVYSVICETPLPKQIL